MADTLPSPPMRVTDIDDTLATVVDTASPRLRVDVYDPIARRKGYETVTEQAIWHGIHRSTMHALRSGDGEPKLGTAMRIAEDCGVPIAKLFGPRPATVGSAHAEAAA